MRYLEYRIAIETGLMIGQEGRPGEHFRNATIEDTLRELDANASGLSDPEVESRQKKYGFNLIEEKKKNPVIEFLKRYWGPMPWLLEFAAILSGVLGHYDEAIIIIILLTINAVIGFSHSRSAGKALKLLKKKLSVTARVLRNGAWKSVAAGEIVPGDVVSVDLGDIVPADMKILSGQVAVDQAALTGESLPVDLGQGSMAFSGTVVTRGRCTGIIVATGANTYFGRTTELVKIAKPKSHQEEIMLSIVRYVLYIGIIALAVTSVDSLIIHISDPLVNILTFAVIFLMGSIPVALPAVLSIVQAVGALELAKSGALVTRLDSIEDAASLEYLYLDKTGTITLNKLSVVGVTPIFPFTSEEVSTLGGLASSADSKDTIDSTIIAYSSSVKSKFGSSRQVEYTPFHPSTKRSESLIEWNGKRLTVTKGAPQIILAMCPDTPEEFAKQVNRSVEDASQRGNRTLGVALSEENGKFKMAGILALADPPRPDSMELISDLKHLSIKPVMLTGDNLLIAKQIAKDTGFGSNVIGMNELREVPEDEQVARIEDLDGLAEIYPEDKYRIVKITQARGHIVGMTGDGVNDSPALKQAEMGIAVSNATDVAKASAAVVLTQPGLRVILDAIRVSRQTYERMLTWVLNKVSKTIEIVILLAAAFFWIHALAVTLLGMVLIIFTNDFATMSISTDNVKSAASPRKWSMGNITLAAGLVGLLFVVQGLFVIYAAIYYFDATLAVVQGMVVLNLIINSQFRILVVRERGRFWSSLPGWELLLTVIIVIVSFSMIGIVGATLLPIMTVGEVIFILIFGAVFTIASDFVKSPLFKYLGLGSAGSRKSLQVKAN